MKKTNLDNNAVIEINRQCYDALGADYTEGVPDFEIIEKNNIWQKFLENLPKDGKKMLNVACGTGDTSVWLDNHGYEVTSTDLSPEMVKVTAEKMPNSRNLVLGATELDQLGNEKFDGIFAIHLIQHLNKSLIEKFFQQVHDLLSDDGKFLLVFTNNCFPESGYQLEGSKEDLYIVWYKHNLEDIVPLLNKAHLAPIEFWTQTVLPDACGVDCPFAFICQKS
jgi:ubiquinone/menaquinone biosynthesis C-methylase UbiE